MTVCLVMIVKNEEHVITRSLQSALPYVDTWCIVDTGSTDKTMDIIRSVTKAAGKEGILYERPWVNFGKNRSDALELARPMASWSFMMDADDIAMFPAKFPEFPTNVEGCTILIKIGYIQTYRTHFFNNKYPWSFVGVVHEVPDLEGKNTIVSPLPDVYYINARSEGSRSTDPKRFEKDAFLLEDDLLKNPTNTRSMFYAAQSWRDCGNKEKAIQWYEKRAAAGGWPQEVYISLLNLIHLNENINIKFIYAWRALDIVPERLETTHAILKSLREQNLWSTQAYVLGLTASKLRGEVKDGMLFAQHDVYAYEFDDEFSVQAFYTNHPEDCMKASLRALEKAPKAQHARIKNNYEFSKSKLA
jgi:glycosyltransferase involved in cell wall biosynthesis